MRGAKFLQDRFEHLLGPQEHVIVPIPYRAIAHLSEESGTLRIPTHAVLVLPAIDLDNQSCFKARKICDVGRDRELATEFESGQSSATQRFPKLRFGICLITA